MILTLQLMAKKSVKEVKDDLIQVEESVLEPIENLKGIGPVTAGKLNECGIYTVTDLATCTPKELVEKTGMKDDDAIGYVSKAKQVLIESGTIRKTFMSGSEVADYRERKVDRLSTGSKVLDELLGGGIESEAVTEFYGAFSAGKTQLCHTACVMAMMPYDYKCRVCDSPSTAEKFLEKCTICNEEGKEPNDQAVIVNKGGLNAKIVWLDTENTFRPERIKQIGWGRGLIKSKEQEKEMLDRIIHARIHNSAHQMATLGELSHIITDDYKDKGKDDPKIRVLVVDSIMALFRTEYLGRGTLQDRQSKLGQHMKKIARLAETFGLVAIITNQVQESPSAMAFMDPTKPTGGNALGHVSSYRLYLKKYGKKRVAKMVDSPSHPDIECVFTVTQDQGVTDFEKESKDDE